MNMRTYSIFLAIILFTTSLPLCTSSNEPTFFYNPTTRCVEAGIGTVLLGLWMNEQNKHSSTAIQRFPLAERRAAITRSLDRGLEEGTMKRSMLTQLDHIQGNMHDISKERRSANTRRWLYGMGALLFYGLAIGPWFKPEKSTDTELDYSKN